MKMIGSIDVTTHIIILTEQLLYWLESGSLVCHENGSWRDVQRGLLFQLHVH